MGEKTEYKKSCETVPLNGTSDSEGHFGAKKVEATYFDNRKPEIDPDFLKGQCPQIF